MTCEVNFWMISVLFITLLTIFCLVVLYLYPEVILDTASEIFCIVVSKSTGFFSKKPPTFSFVLY